MTPTKPAASLDKLYTAGEVAELLARYRDQLRMLAEIHPELTLVFEDFAEVVHHEADPLLELGALLSAGRDTFVELRHLINPTGLPLHMTEDGRVLSRTFRGVTAFLTDIRGFTELTRSVADRWGMPIFELLSNNYFHYMTDVLESFRCHYLNYTGDGLLVLSRDVVDESGRVVLPSLDNAVLCALDLTLVTDSIAEAWRSQGLTREDGTPHTTGLGLTFGDVSVGDPFVPEPAPTGPREEFDRAFRSALAERAPHIRPTSDFRRRVRAIHALSPTINRASRLQDMDKLAPGHAIMMIGEDVGRLCPPLRALFERVGEMTLKGIGVADVHAMPRRGPIDVPALNRECRDYFARRA